MPVLDDSRAQHRETQDARNRCSLPNNSSYQDKRMARRFFKNWTWVRFQIAVPMTNHVPDCTTVECRGSLSSQCSGQASPQPRAWWPTRQRENGGFSACAGKGLSSVQLGTAARLRVCVVHPRTIQQHGYLSATHELVGHAAEQHTRHTTTAMGRQGDQIDRQLLCFR